MPSAEVAGRLAPLYVFILIGWLAARRLRVPREPISALLIYFFAPIMVFVSILRVPHSMSAFLLTPGYWLVSSLIAIVTFRVLPRFRGPTGNLFAFGAGNANTGYFGIPITAALVGAEAVDFAVLVALGLILYENSVGFYITARAHFSARRALINLAKLPSIYAVVVALGLRLADVVAPSWVLSLGEMVRSTYSVLGFTIIGLSLALVSARHLDVPYLVASHAAKFMIWPLLTVAALVGARSLGFGFDETTKGVMAVMALVPMAANTVVFAALLKVEPEKASVAVFFSTLVSLALYASGLHQWIMAL